MSMTTLQRTLVRNHITTKPFDSRKAETQPSNACPYIIVVPTLLQTNTIIVPSTSTTTHSVNVHIQIHNETITSAEMSNLPARYVPAKGILSTRGGDPRRGGSRACGPRGGGSRGGQYNNNIPRDNYGPANGGYPYNQQPPQMPQSGFYDPYGNWIISPPPFNPYNNGGNNNNGYSRPSHHNNQWRSDQQSDNSADQADDTEANYSSLKTKFNKTQGQFLAMKDENAELKDKNEALKEENMKLRETSGTLIKHVEDFGKMMKELETKNKVLKAQLGKAREKDTSVKENGVDQADIIIVVDDNEDLGITIKGAGAGKVKSTEKIEESAKPVPTKHRARGAMKDPSEAMKALIEAGEKQETEAEALKVEEAAVTETEAVEEEKEWAPNEDDIDLTVDADTNQEDDVDVTLVADTNQEDYIDYGIDDLNETEEAVVPEAKPVEVLMKKRKASEDEEASVVEKKPKRVRNRK